MVYFSEEEVMNMEKYEDIGGSVWREPTPEEDKVVRMWCGYAWRSRILSLLLKGIPLLILFVILIVSGLRAPVRTGHARDVNLTAIGVLAAIVTIFAGIMFIRGYVRSRKNILARNYKVAEATVVDKRMSYGRNGRIKQFVTVQNGDRRDEITVYDPSNDDIYDNAQTNTRMLLVRYPDDVSGFYDKMDLIYPEPFYCRIKQEKGAASDD